MRKFIFSISVMLLVALAPPVEAQHVEFSPGIFGMNEINDFLVDMIYMESTQSVTRKVPVYQYKNGAYVFVKWADKDQTTNTTNQVVEYGTGNTSLRNNPTRSNATVYTQGEFTYIKFDHGQANLQYIPTGPPTSAKKYWPVLSNTTTYKLRNAAENEISSILPYATIKDGVLINNTFVDEMLFINNPPNGQPKPAYSGPSKYNWNFSWWVDLYQGGLPGAHPLKGTAMSIPAKARYSPSEFMDATLWEVVPSDHAEIDKINSKIYYDQTKGAVIRLLLVNNSGIYDDPMMGGEPKTSMYEYWINLHE